MQIKQETSSVSTPRSAQLPSPRKQKVSDSVYEAEISKQLLMVSKLDNDVLTEQKATEMLADFDESHETLVDYFAIIGPDHIQLLKLIQEMANGFHSKGTEYDERIRETDFGGPGDGLVWIQSQGRYRVLEPKVLARFPKQDRNDKLFPTCFHDYFFEQRETVHSPEQVSEYERSQENEEAYESIGLKDIRGRHRYVTTHVFFEDLANIQANLQCLFRSRASRIGAKLEKGRYFVKKGFCLLTSCYPASKELNRINVFLRKLCTSENMFDRFEAYVAKLLFSVPLPSRIYAVTAHLHLPRLDQDEVSSLQQSDHEVLKLSLPGWSELPPVNDEAIQCLFSHLSMETITRLLKYMLLEERIVLIGTRRNDIVHCCEALRSLIYPLKYDHGGNWYTSYISLRDWSRSEYSFPAMIGLDKKLLPVAEVQELTTWIVDLDADKLWKSRDRKIQLQQRSSKDDVRPCFPASALEALNSHVSVFLPQTSSDLQQQSAISTQPKQLSVQEVGKVRSIFFQFFCRILRHFQLGIENSDWKTYGKQDELLPEHPDPGYVFDMQSFLEAYRREGSESTLVFLEDFAERPAFGSLIERWIDEKDQVDIYVFKKRLNDLTEQQIGVRPDDERDLVTDRQNQIVNICPFFDLMQHARKCEQDDSFRTSYFSDESFILLNNPSGADAKNNHPLITQSVTSTMLNMMDTGSGPVKKRFSCQVYRYHATPQFLDNAYLMHAFTERLASGDELQSFVRQSQAFYPQSSTSSDLTMGRAATPTGVKSLPLLKSERARETKAGVDKSSSSSKSMLSKTSKRTGLVLSIPQSSMAAPALTKREELQANYDFKNDRANILYCWLLAWCGTFKAQQRAEREFLVCQAIQVIKKMCTNQDTDLTTYVLLMLQVVFSLAQPEFLRYLVELWKYDLQLPTTQAFEYYDFKASERSTTFRAAYRQAHLTEREKRNLAQQAAALQVAEDGEEAEEAAQNQAMGIGKIDAEVIQAQFSIDEIEDFQFDTLAEFLDHIKTTHENLKRILDETNAKQQAASLGKIKRLMFKVKHKFKTFFDNGQDDDAIDAISLVGGGASAASQKSLALRVRLSSDGLAKSSKDSQQDVKFATTHALPSFMQKGNSAPPKLNKKSKSMALNQANLSQLSPKNKLGNIVEEEEQKVNSSSNAASDSQSYNGDKEEAKREEGDIGPIKSDSLPERHHVDSKRRQPHLRINSSQQRERRPTKPQERGCRQSQLEFIRKVSCCGKRDRSKNGGDVRRSKHSSMSNYFLNPASHEYQSIRRKNNFSKRSFLLPEEQMIEDYMLSDSVIVTLQHVCPNPICKKLVDSDRILQNARASYYTDPRTNSTKRRFHWECYNCAHEIKPLLRIRVSRNSARKVEKVPLFHAVELRNLIEVFLKVDKKYQAVRQRSLESLRHNHKLYWNLIYYLSVMGLPFEFLIPYEPKDLFKDLVNVFDVKSHRTLMEAIRAEGIGYLDCFLEAKLKKQKKRERQEMEKAKQTGFQIMRMITTTKAVPSDAIIEEPPDEQLSNSFADRQSLTRESTIRHQRRQSRQGLSLQTPPSGQRKAGSSRHMSSSGTTPETILNQNSNERMTGTEAAAEEEDDGRGTTELLGKMTRYFNKRLVMEEDTSAEQQMRMTVVVADLPTPGLEPAKTKERAKKKVRGQSL